MKASELIARAALLACMATAVAPVAWSQLPPNPVQNLPQNEARNGQTPLYRITAVDRVAKTVNYRHRGGATREFPLCDLGQVATAFKPRRRPQRFGGAPAPPSMSRKKRKKSLSGEITMVVPSPSALRCASSDRQKS